MKNLCCLAVSAFILLTSFVRAQDHIHCGTDEMHQQLFLQHPEYNAGIVRANDRLQQFTESYIQNPPKDGDPYIIPVVFHIIHNYGIENIGDAQVLDAVKQLNIQYRKLNADTTGIVQAFKSRAADCNIEFRLAQLDPNGNCTSGITRTVSELTMIGDHQVKSLIHWPPNKYLNVYICNQAAGLAGHSMMPAAADTAPEWDGIVMQHSYLGTIGTSEYFRRTVLSHEVGHFLNLQHIWGGNNVPGYYYLPVAAAGNCAYDDDVTDTPNTIGWQTCNLAGQTCGELDNVQNYMDYSYCALMFTEGQKQRMHAALNSSVAGRNNLWQQANLEATGTDDLTYYLCGAKFMADKQVICAGETVSFTDISYHGVTDRKWTFEGASVSTSVDSLETVTYPQPGTFDVTLKVSNGDDTLELVMEDYMTVLPAGSIAGIDQQFENDQPYYDNWITVDKGTPYNWDFTNIGYASSRSFKLDNFNGHVNTAYEFFSHPIDASGLTSLAISFDWAYGRIEGSDVDFMKVLVSEDCGGTWHVVKSYIGSSSLKTVEGFVTGPFTPADETQWKSALITNISPSYLTDKLMVKFQFENHGTNNIYIDNIQVGHPDQLSLNQLSLQNIHLFPNPSNGSVTAELGEKHGVKSISVYNLAGQLVKTFGQISQSPAAELSTKEISDGYYLFHIEGSRGKIVVPQIVKH